MSWESNVVIITQTATDSKNTLTSIFTKANEINLTISNDYDTNYDLNKFDNIAISLQNLKSAIDIYDNNILNRGIDIILVADQADQFVCNSIDTFERLIDIRTFAINDDLISKLNDMLYAIKSTYINKFSSTSTSVEYNNSTDVALFNTAVVSCFNDLLLLITKIEEYTLLINTANTNIETFSKILRVNTTVGIALSVSSKSWRLARKLNKHNYTTVLGADIPIVNINTELKDSDIYPFELFSVFPKYVIRSVIESYIKESDILNINKSFSISLNSNEYLDIVVTETDVDLITNSVVSDSIFRTAPNLSVLNDNFNEFNYLYDYNSFENMVKNAYVISNYDNIKLKISGLSDSLKPNSTDLSLYNSLGYDLADGLTSNLKNFIISKNSHNIIYNLFNYKYAALKEYDSKINVTDKYEYYIPSSLDNLNWLYTTGYSNLTSDAKKIYDAIFGNDSTKVNQDLKDDYAKFLKSKYEKVFEYSFKNKNKIVTIFLKNIASHATTMIKRSDSVINVSSNIVKTVAGLIEYTNPMTKASLLTFKNFNKHYIKLTDTYLDVADALATDTRDFIFDGIYNYDEKGLVLESFVFSETKTTTNGYEGDVYTYWTKIRSETSGSKHKILGTIESSKTTTSYITDNPVVRIATNVANVYRKLLLENKLGYNDARYKAIIHTLQYLRYKESFNNLIDKSWDLLVPRYDMED